MKKFLALYCLCLSALPAGAQTWPPQPEESTHAALAAQAAISASTLAQFTAEDYTSMELPPLETLLENAKETSRMKYVGFAVEQEKMGLKSERRNWLHFIKLYAGYQYGRLNDLTTTTDYMYPGNYYNYIGRQQNFYNIGASLNSPLDEIFDRKNRIQRQRSRVHQAEANVGREHELISMEIVGAYTSALSMLAMIKIRSEAATLASAQYKISETDFINGKITAQTLSVQKNLESSTLREYEQTRETLNNALLKLEYLSRTKIIKKL